MTHKDEVREKAKTLWAQVHSREPREVCRALLVLMLEREQKEAEKREDHALARRLSDLARELVMQHDY